MENEFRFFKLDKSARFVLAAALYIAGIAVVLVSDRFFLLGLILSAAGWFPLMLRKTTNKPQDQGLEEWRAVPMSEVDKLEDAIRETTRTMSKSGEIPIKILGGILLAIFFLAAMTLLAIRRWDLGFLCLEAGVFLVPALFFGRLVLHKPKDIAFKLPSFRSLLKAEPAASVTITPYIRFDKDVKGADVPEDLRVLYETKRGPEDFIGIQVQCSKNKGPNGEVPYLYAVVLTRGREGKSYRMASGFGAHGYIIEKGGDETYGTVVIRQITTGTGYHTKAADCERLGMLCADLASSIMSGSSRAA